MDPNLNEAETRRTQLLGELEVAYKKLERDGLWNVRGRDLCLIVGVIASLGTAAIHLAGNNSQWILWLPIVATGAQALTATMKFPELGRWNFQKASMVFGLAQRLKYEMPEAPTIDNVAAISKEFRELEQRMPQESIQPQSTSLPHHGNH
jgi:Zn-dependent protease with chaperone function